MLNIYIYIYIYVYIYICVCLTLSVVKRLNMMYINANTCMYTFKKKYVMFIH